MFSTKMYILYKKVTFIILKCVFDIVIIGGRQTGWTHHRLHPPQD